MGAENQFLDLTFEVPEGAIVSALELIKPAGRQSSQIHFDLRDIPLK